MVKFYAVVGPRSRTLSDVGL